MEGTKLKWTLTFKFNLAAHIPDLILHGYNGFYSGILKKNYFILCIAFLTGRKVTDKKRLKQL